jgi:uncharacterized protein YggE
MRTLILLCLLPAAALAQFDNNVITVTASRQVNAPPDQVNVMLTVTTDENQTLDSVVAALAGSVAVTDLASVSSYGSGRVDWRFNVTVPIANLAKSIAAWQVGASKAIYAVDYYVQNSSSSAQAQCPYPALISDARAQAAKLASAAGVTLGPIVTLSTNPAASPVVYDPTAYSLQAVLGTPATLFGVLLTTPRLGGIYPPCSLTIQFQMGR